MPCTSCGNKNQRQPNGGAVFMGSRVTHRRLFYQAKPAIRIPQPIKKKTISKNNTMIFGTVRGK